MKFYLLKIKTKQTLYLDKEDNIWSTIDPRDWGCEDYEIVRKGTILDVFRIEKSDRKVILVSDNEKIKIIFKNRKAIKTIGWFDILEENK